MLKLTYECHCYGIKLDRKVEWQGPGREEVGNHMAVGLKLGNWNFGSNFSGQAFALRVFRIMG